MTRNLGAPRDMYFSSHDEDLGDNKSTVPSWARINEASWPLMDMLTAGPGRQVEPSVDEAHARQLIAARREGRSSPNARNRGLDHAATFYFGPFCSVRDPDRGSAPLHDKVKIFRDYLYSTTISKDTHDQEMLAEMYEILLSIMADKNNKCADALGDSIIRILEALELAAGPNRRMFDMSDVLFKYPAASGSHFVDLVKDHVRETTNTGNFCVTHFGTMGRECKSLTKTLTDIMSTLFPLLTEDSSTNVMHDVCFDGKVATNRTKFMLDLLTHADLSQITLSITTLNRLAYFVVKRSLQLNEICAGRSDVLSLRLSSNVAIKFRMHVAANPMTMTWCYVAATESIHQTGTCSIAPMHPKTIFDSNIQRARLLHMTSPEHDKEKIRKCAITLTRGVERMAVCLGASLPASMGHYYESTFDLFLKSIEDGPGTTRSLLMVLREVEAACTEILQTQGPNFRIIPLSTELFDHPAAMGMEFTSLAKNHVVATTNHTSFFSTYTLQLAKLGLNLCLSRQRELFLLAEKVIFDLLWGSTRSVEEGRAVEFDLGAVGMNHHADMLKAMFRVTKEEIFMFFDNVIATVQEANFKARTDDKVVICSSKSLRVTNFDKTVQYKAFVAVNPHTMSSTTFFAVESMMSV